MKIAVFEVEAWEREAFEPLQREHEVFFAEEQLSTKNAERFSDCQIISTFIYSRIDARVIETLPRLQMIASRSTGFDHIDTERCDERGITVANVPTYGENTVAEHVFALLLAISHRLVDAVDRTRRGDFSQQGLQGFDLAGRTLGIIGTGNIGRYVARIAKGFGMQVVAFDIKPDHDLAKEIGFEYVEMDELLDRTDVVTLHVPGGEATRNLLSHAQFARMKRGAILINTARASVVDVDALLHALSDGTVAAAGLDVLPEEPAIREEAELLRRYFAHEHNLDSLLAGHLLLRMRNVIITPHSAFNTREAVQRILDTTLKNIRGYLSGSPVNIVNEPATTHQSARG